MPKYQYKAIDSTGKIIRGKVVSLSMADVEENLSRKGLTLIKSKPLKKGIRGKLEYAGKIKPRILIEFYHRLSQTLVMGLPMLTALEENAKILPSKSFSMVVTEVKVSIESGKTLYEAMSRYPKVFNKLDLAIIRLGEQSGVLPNAMKDLADFLEWKEDIRSTIKKATIYPSFVIFIIIAVIGVWVGYVLPQMAGLLTEMGVALPEITKTILSTSLFFSRKLDVDHRPCLRRAIISIYVSEVQKRENIVSQAPFTGSNSRKCRQKHRPCTFKPKLRDHVSVRHDHKQHI